MFEIDWDGLVRPTHPLLEIAVRGTIVYFALFLALRFLPRREIGSIGASDVLVIVLIADAVQDAISAGGYDSVTEGLLLAGVIFGWSTFMDWLDYRFPEAHIAAAGPVRLVQDGRILRRNMAREHVTEDELMAQLRVNGCDSLDRVRAAYIEGDGKISVLKRS